LLTWVLMRNLILILFIASNAGLSAQVEPDKLPTVNQFVKLIERELNIGDGENANWFKAEFAPVFSDSTDSALQDSIISTVIGLRSHQIKTSTGVLGYLKGVLALIDSDAVDLVVWSDWHLTINAFLENKKWRKKLSPYLELSEGLLSNQIIADSRSSVWQFKGGNIKIGVDSIPFVDLNNGVLVCYAKGDSSRIHNTSGRFYPTLGKWRGTGGAVHWEATVFNDSTQFATLSNYEIKLSGTSFLCSPAIFHTELFERNLIGELKFKVKASRNIKDKDYPRFESDDDVLTLKNIFHGIDFEGGVIISGSSIHGKGVGDEPGHLKIYKDDTLFINCTVYDIIFHENGFGATDSELAIYLENDSIYHPGLSVRYDSKGRTLMFILNEEGVGQQAFTDSYHKIEFKVEAITWKIGSPTIDFGSLLLSGRGVGVFRSISNFDIGSYNNMMGIAPIHPLSELWHFIKTRPVKGFYVSEYAYFLKLSQPTVQLMLIDLALNGYVSYDPDDKWCEWLPKADNHLKCKKGRADYDVLAFRSDVSTGANARLGISNKQMQINGIRAFKVSDAQNVVVVPEYGVITMSENRSFTFAGGVKAGKFEFSGRNFEFNYNTFSIELNSVDEMHIRAEVVGEYSASGRPKTRLIRNTIDGITGSIQIDDPSNKSGWRSEYYPDYPVLSSTGPSYVYYDSHSIHKGAYHRNRFRYALDPFEIDSLDNFVKDNLLFSGELLAGGIVPDLQVDLRLMDDFSLGIEASSPLEGYPLYEGLGVIHADLELNMDGLQAAGSIDYLSSHISGDNMVLVPDSAFGITTSYTNESIFNHVPAISSSISYFALHSDVEMLDVITEQERLRCFGDDVMLTGEIHLNTSGMIGSGEFEFEDAYISSSLFDMSEISMSADTADFEITGDDLNALAFKTVNVQADIDFDDRIGDFISHAGLTEIELPAIRYLCTMDKFRWFMDLDQIQLENTTASASNTNFTSVHPDQDSLRFASTIALYKVGDAVVECQNVETMIIADSEIWPNNGEVVVRRDAHMDPLFKAVIYTNRETRYHRFFESSVLVKGRLDYRASATYLYKDVNGLEWPIYFDKIDVDSSYSTVGIAKIPLSQDFFLDPYFEFTGDVTLIANRENLEFDGGARLSINCEGLNMEWIEFSAVIDPKEIAIPIGDVISELGKAHLGVGILLSDAPPFDAYSAFFTKKPDRGDICIFKPEGELRFDKRKDRYVVSTAEKLRDKTVAGTMNELPANGCGVYSSGRTTLPFDLNIINHEFVGDAWIAESGKIKMRGTLALNIYMDSDLEKVLATQINSSARSTPLDFSATSYEYALTEIVGEEITDKAITELMRDGFYKKMPSEIQYTFMLTGLEFTYDKYEDSFVSTAEVGIATIGSHSVFRTIPGRVELIRDRGRDELVIYLHLGENHWYYFEYDTYFNFETNDNNFMEVWNKLNSSDKMLNNHSKDETLRMQVSRHGRRDNFVDRFRDFN